MSAVQDIFGLWNFANCFVDITCDFGQLYLAASMESSMQQSSKTPRPPKLRDACILLRALDS